MMKKPHLHLRNRHQGKYPLDLLIAKSPGLKKLIQKNKMGADSIDFSNPEAVFSLNQALLKYYYDINYPKLPSAFLIPPIPGRADYIHHLADLLAEGNQGTIPSGRTVKILDIGVGANIIYPIIGQCEYGWSFRASDINLEALKQAQIVIKNNSEKLDSIELVLQKNKSQIFEGVINEDEFFDATICNPPFYSSQEEAIAESSRKWRNLGFETNKKNNFGGHGAELWCEGGELAFVKRMILESVKYKRNCTWFTTLISREKNLEEIQNYFKKNKITQTKIIDMAQGQKKSRIQAWTFK